MSYVPLGQTRHMSKFTLPICWQRLVRHLKLVSMTTVHSHVVAITTIDIKSN